MNLLTNISPIDGRYKTSVEELSEYFSEMALMRYRLMVEIEYLIALSIEKNINEIEPLTLEQQNKLKSYYKNFSNEDAQSIKKIEETTNHDVKAIEYFLKEKLQNTKFNKYIEFIHFALTSEDINNLAYTLMWNSAIKNIYLPKISEVQEKFIIFAKKNKHQPMLSLTHGQSATPTTVGKEFAVFAHRLQRQILQLSNHKLQGKFGGATGTWGAHNIAYPNIDWINFSKNFISSLNLEPNIITIQIESHDSITESYQIIERINTILIDFTRDIWMYISRGIFGQKKKDNEIGSSAMPHKINPIQFENAEGNLGIANAYFVHLSQKLPISRMQRDLTDSTVLRNQGIPLAHSLLACKNILKGMSRLTINKEKLDEELNNHWEVLAEAIQTVMRKVGYEKPYEKLKELTRGEKVNKQTIYNFINSLEIPEEEKNKLLKLTPHTYIGLSTDVVDLI
ncbi:MAG: adenylosuccinate lyase [Candidatus Magasanikbacteria bacterium RIFCSPHIGHO2_01_FULL_33_34]|uniref:Adenylosuccinate lyase n=1 Tax=Candidatus Magasanikbacteria bacterium RIFCSPHIGHO2_01_FULL_33_34 TaxID=1798671 RepID=A0A1F6LHQ6_9BACT|nr:MAG: adenylosuccinate lyase [Candidatus Magasanikbacteria bacterium RIFCSPHIGHO2_01_FULL_33_34]OGH65092.1 MAG: adenylosuccinate lyase [Candidatus Magasanikbacteria bacterium RIFCSPHIGHO2_02_FULL_33_17]OGH75364.1 MAG: adenylosuccinate lyase [Candidatus Magasanikbacteria bacterium RIFCSPLOWO2_01_FULL_33_34]OGH81730.1 MAG: adenylosuccinate lyase [Candidatus Magasanikbacteria bacterium RIFCSPLOWO2_12_FULL_34_7]